jgi:hypothetical protein
MDTSWLGDSYCVSLVRDLAADTALTRLGADQVRVLTLAEAVQLGGPFDAGYPLMAVATSAGTWTAVLEVHGIEGSRPEALRALSRDTEVLTCTVQKPGRAS